MARGVLSEGRLTDAVRMIEPLLDAAPADDDPGQILLRCLLSRAVLLLNGDHQRAVDLLHPFERSDLRADLEASLRAEVSLWLGWAGASRDDDTFDEARALNLLDAAEQDFRDEVDPSGRCWALLGQARVYCTMEEPRLMRQALVDAAPLVEKLDDVQADLWFHHLSGGAARFEGRYAAAARHIEFLEARAREARDTAATGRALAHRAIVGLETGRKPADIVEAARLAEQLLTGVAPSTMLATAFGAHAAAETRAGNWSEAAHVLARGEEKAARTARSRARFGVLRARLRLLEGDAGAASAELDDAEALSRRRRHRSDVERLRSEIALESDRYAEAVRHADEAIRLSGDTGHGGDRLAALLLKARASVAAGDVEGAVTAMRRAETHAEYFSLLPFAADRFYIHSLIAERRDRADDARASMGQALSTFTLIGDLHASTRTQRHLARLSAGRDAVSLPEGAPMPAPSVDRPASDIGCILARSALSVELVSESWLQAAEALAPNRWLVVSRCDPGGTWSIVHRHGKIPDDLTFPDPGVERLCAEGVDWMRLRGLPAPAFFFGMECGGDDDPACAAIEKQLLPWLPVVGLALEHALLRSARLFEPADTDAEPFDPNGFIHASPGMRRVAHQIRRIRSGHAPVLVTGEHGVGKSLVARTVHDAGDRQEAPFVPFNCSAVSHDDIAEALFGHGSRSGALHAAEHGTLYLKEVGALPTALQSRLLHFIETGTYESTAGPAPLDVRIIASTSRDVNHMVREGTFLEDLHYRLAVVPIRVPPLRERREEIPLLVHHFLKDLTHGRTGSASITSRAVDALLRYDWPGNVRQLRNEIERVLVFAVSEPISTIDVDDLSDAIRHAHVEPTMEPDGTLDGVALNGRGLDEILANAERSVIEQILARHDGQVSATAEALGLSRQGLYKKMKRLGIDAAAVTER